MKALFRKIILEVTLFLLDGEIEKLKKSNNQSDYIKLAEMIEQKYIRDKMK